ncbi:MAG: glutamine--fructose-6-phosphate transaminase (isomerizing) [Candidatus Tectomicrobia bacterium]|nr:glutamine--fructose-6-phosphate transaminase (isomerizing) [Candidatus Tectomicrobia bacterium]
MCGISGVAGHRAVAADLFQCIRNLEYRGYDSCGVALINNGRIEIRKNVGTVDEVNALEGLTEVGGDIGIAHTRWATHGKVSKENTHPHTCCKGEIAVVHNGIIANYRDLRERLQAGGHIFRSETDTEVVAHLIEENLDAGLHLEDAFRRAVRELKGTFALAVIALPEKDRILCAKKESPLILGVGESCNFIGSDFNAFIEFTKHAVVLDDGEMAIVTRDGFTVKDCLTGRTVRKNVMEIQWDAEMSKRGGYPHYMLKEIYEQPRTVEHALGLDRAELSRLAGWMEESARTYLIGTGTTYYVSLTGQYLFSRLANRFLPAVSSDEFRELAQADGRTLVLVSSQSGETYDTLSALRFAREKGARTAAIVNVMGSSIARLADSVIAQGAGPEICVLSTKAALSQMIILLLIALELGCLTGHLSEGEREALRGEVAQLPGLIETILNERSGFIHTVAHRCLERTNWLYLGRGVYYAIAMEAALKMKEVTYLHAEGMPAGFLKHGTISLIDDRMASMVFIPPPAAGDLYTLSLSSAEEIKARGGYVLGVHTEGDREAAAICDETIALPRAPLLVTPFLHLIAGQLFAYFTATGLKRNIDRPRSLAKSVTVA